MAEIAFKQNSTLRMTTTKQYDLLKRLTNISSTTASFTNSFAYRYNDANQRTKVTREDGSYWNYGYDDLGQVTSGKRYWADNLGWGEPVDPQEQGGLNLYSFVTDSLINYTDYLGLACLPWPTRKTYGPHTFFDTHELNPLAQTFACSMRATRTVYISKFCCVNVPGWLPPCRCGWTHVQTLTETKIYKVDQPQVLSAVKSVSQAFAAWWADPANQPPFNAPWP